MGKTRRLSLLALALALGGCSMNASRLGGGEAAPPPEFEASAPGTGSVRTAPERRLVEIRAELRRLRGAVDAGTGEYRRLRSKILKETGRYSSAVAALNRRLEAGATPGSPELVARWNEAQENLLALERDIAGLRTLAAAADRRAEDAAALGNGLRSIVDGGADPDDVAEVEADLAVLQDANDRLAGEIAAELERDVAYLDSEKETLLALSLKVKEGGLAPPSERPSPAPPRQAAVETAPLPPASAAAPPPPASEAKPSPPAAAAASGAAAPAAPAAAPAVRPLVIIRFDRPDVDFREALYTAVSRALERRPDAVFRLVGIAPARPGEADRALGRKSTRSHLLKVMRTLTRMGLPADQIDLLATTSPDVATDEVHIYVR